MTLASVRSIRSHTRAPSSRRSQRSSIPTSFPGRDRCMRPRGNSVRTIRAAGAAAPSATLDATRTTDRAASTPTCRSRKAFAITERFRAKFVMDAFNVFNHPVFAFSANNGANGCVDCQGGNNGKITGLEGGTGMRQIQFCGAVRVLASNLRLCSGGSPSRTPSFSRSRLDPTCMFEVPCDGRSRPGCVLISI